MTCYIPSHIILLKKNLYQNLSSAGRIYPLLAVACGTGTLKGLPFLEALSRKYFAAVVK